MAMLYVVCPRCMKGHMFNKPCATPECIPELATKEYKLDALEGQLYIAQQMAIEEPKNADWEAEILSLKAQMVALRNDVAVETSNKGAQA